MLTAIGANHDWNKTVFAVDEDVDINDFDDVWWAYLTRGRADTRATIICRCAGLLSRSDAGSLAARRRRHGPFGRREASSCASASRESTRSACATISIEAAILNGTVARRRENSVGVDRSRRLAGDGDHVALLFGRAGAADQFSVTLDRLRPAD